MLDCIRDVLLAATIVMALCIGGVPLASREQATRLPSASPGAQAPTGAITGIVVDGDTDMPLTDALVYLSARGVPASEGQPRQLTDARGRFAFTNLPPSEGYTIRAVRVGYLTSGFGPPEASTAASRTLTLGAAEWLPDVRVPLWKPGWIAGTVRDEAGDAVVGVRVRLVSRIRVAGRSHLAAGPVTFTDDLGEYRFAGLPPGAYVVLVPSIQTSVPTSLPGRNQPVNTPAESLLSIDPRVLLSVATGPVPPPFDGRLLVYPTSFAGGQTLAEASTIEIAPGVGRDGIDVRLAPVPAGTVTGRLLGSADDVTNLLVRLVPEGLEDLAEGEAAITRPDPDGRFMLVGVPAGTYSLDVPASVNEYLYADVQPGAILPVRHPSPLVAGSGSSTSSVNVGPPGTAFVSRRYNGGSTVIGAASVVVTEGTTADVSVTLRPLGAIAGRVVLEPVRTDPSAPTVVGVSAEAADGSPRFPRPTNAGRPAPPDWTFRLEGFGAGTYRLRANATPPWMIKSIQAGGRDYTDDPVDMAATTEVADVIVTLTDAGAVLTGTVRSDGSEAGGGVLLFPVNRDLWRNYGTHSTRLNSVAVTADGKYRFTQVPAGDYYVLAVGSSEATAWQDPEFLATAATRAIRVAIAWGDTLTQDLRREAR